jgi:hypothetical protein
MTSSGGGNILAPISSEAPGKLQNSALVEEAPVVAEAHEMSVNLDVSASSLLTFTSSCPSRLFALIIGINQYKHSAYDLQGAVCDGERMKAYLESLDVPTCRIRTLFNEAATRKAIVTSLRELQTEEEIRDGDPILIFYAGHGGTAKTPVGWDAGSDRIQVLLPHDFRYTSSGRLVHAIPDRTILSLLENIASTKGDNIVRPLTISWEATHTESFGRLSSLTAATPAVWRVIRCHCRAGSVRKYRFPMILTKTYGA